MVGTENILIFIFSLFVFIIGLNSIYNSKRSNGSNGNGNGLLALVNRIDEKDNIIEDYVSKNAKQDIIIKRQDDELAALTARIQYLEKIIEQEDYQHVDFVQPQLLLITSNVQFQQTDEIALNRAGVAYRRLSGATIEAIEGEFRRRRQVGRMYEYVVFSAHMSSRGILLTDGDILDSYWLNTNLKGVKLVILNGCESTSIAGDVVGVVDYVISMTEQIPNKVAGGFLFTFWNSMRVSDNILTAYGTAKASEPTAEAYIDLLIKGD